MIIQYAEKSVKMEPIKQLDVGTAFRFNGSYFMKVMRPEHTSGFAMVDLESGFLHVNLTGDEEVVPINCKLIVYDQEK